MPPKCQISMRKNTPKLYNFSQYNPNISAIGSNVDMFIYAIIFRRCEQMLTVLLKSGNTRTLCH